MFEVQGLGCRVSGLIVVMVSGFGFRVWGIGFVRVSIWALGIGALQS